MKLYLDLTGIFKRTLLTFVLLAFIRLVFIFWNLNYLGNIAIQDVLIAYLYGFRFDLATAFIINLVFILFSLFPIKHKGWQNIGKLIFVSFNSVFLIINIVDIEFFQFIGKKMTVDIFDMGGDISDQTIQLLLNYWYFSLPSALLIYFLWRFYPKGKMKAYPWYQGLIFIIMMIIISGIGIRGGIQLRSISPKQAFIFDQHELGNVALNSAYTIARSLSKKPLPAKKYYTSDKAALDFIRSKRDFSQSKLKLNQPNIMILIIESLSQEYIDTGYTPNLSRRFQQGMYFPMNFANGRRSIEALPSILLGIPSILEKPIYQSQFQTNQFHGLPQLLKREGYQTSFFHGGKTGTMDFDAFVASIGVDEYFGKEDYPNSDHYDGNWGIFDHYFLAFMHRKINEMQPPFFTTFFSLSSHQPYAIPLEFKDKFPKGTLEIHESIGYLDYSLEQFFKAIENEPWFKNTLFILTADHTQKLETAEFNNALGRFRVPLWFYHPTLDLKPYASASRITQHSDIFPTILDLTKLKQQNLFFGSSVLSQDAGLMLNYTSGHFIQYRAGTLVKQRGEGFESKPNNEAQEELLKAYIQYGVNGLKFNNIYR